jgi:SAM-dependent methyltransferase
VGNKEMKELYTTKEYWENYYKPSRNDLNTIKTICGKYDIFWDQLVSSCIQKPKSIIEIGAYPGRYIAYLASRFDLHATALDYNSDRGKIENAFSTMGVKNYEIIQADFLKHEPTCKYDLVISNGFIEHFENYDQVLDMHARYLAPGGAMLIMIPNKRYLRKWYGWLVDRDNLKAHNLKCMSLNTFKEFASRNDLNIEFLNYYGGFAYRVHQPLNLFQKLIYKPVRWLSLKLEPILAKHANHWWSGTIISIFSSH